MTAVFERILEMTLTAAVVIVVVMVIRLLLRKAPRKYSYALWSVAAFRLVCPVSFEAFFSLFNFTKQLEEVSVEQTAPAVSPVPSVSDPPYVTSAPYPGPTVSVDPDYAVTYPVTTPPAADPEPVASLLERAMEIAAVIWLIGLAALLIYGIVSYVRLRRRMSTAVRLEGNVWQSDRVQSPFILGFVRPKIYLPFGLTMEQQRYVLAHERYHLKRFDHIVRPLSFLILAVHWFNPFVWLAYYLMSRDMEMSCDEKVLSGGESVKAYSTTLLSFAANRRFPSPSPLAFGESGVKSRIKNALNWKKPRTWVTIIAIVVCIVVIVVCAANPKEAESKNGDPYAWTSTVTAEEIGFAEHYVVGAYGSASLSEAQLQELSEILNAIPEDALVYRSSFVGYKEGAVEIMIEGGAHSLSYLPDGSLILRELVREGYGAGRSEEWEVDSDALKQFMAGLADSFVVDPPAPAELTTYVPFSCFYWDHQALGSETVDGGRSYQIGDSAVVVLDPNDSGAGLSFENLSDWRPLTEEEWVGMFPDGGLVLGISGFTSPMIRDLSDLYQLANMDGQLWIIRKSPLTNDILSIFALAEPLARWQVDLTHDGEDETITVVYDSRLARYTMLVTDVSGQSLWGWDENDMAWGVYLYERDGEHYLMTLGPGGNFNTYDLSYSVFFLDRGMMVTLQENGVKYESEAGLTAADTEAIRAFEAEVNTLLSNAIVLVDTVSGETVYSTPENRIIRTWKSNVDTEEPLVIRQADLTHDGVRETITLTYQEELGLYTLTVANAAGETIWTGEASIYHVGNNGIYLYERDGKQYLMQWNPYGNTGSFFYHYEVFSLTEGGEEVPLVSNSMEFSVMNEETLLQLDIGALRAFEQEVNALLEDTILLISTLEGYTYYSTETVTLCKLWTSMADNWEQRQWEILNSTEPLAVWNADLTHDGRNEIIQISRKTGETVTYCLDIRTADGKDVWNAELHHWKTGWNGFYLYERGGKHYLLEWFPNGQQGWYSFAYRIYCLNEAAEPEILEEESLQYDLGAAGYREKILTVDVEPLRAFEARINALLHDAEVLLVVDENRVVLGNPNAPVSDSWISPADEWESSRQSYAAQLPLAWAGWEGDANLLNCVQEQTKLRMGDYELAYIDGPERITTAAVGTISGDFIYRVEYRPADYDEKTHQLTWHENEYFYLITHEEWGESTGPEDDEWYFVGVLTEAELQSRFNNKEVLEQYDNDLYLAAVVEMARQWSDSQ